MKSFSLGSDSGRNRKEKEKGIRKGDRVEGREKEEAEKQRNRHTNTKKNMETKIQM